MLVLRNILFVFFAHFLVICRSQKKTLKIGLLITNDVTNIKISKNKPTAAFELAILDANKNILGNSEFILDYVIAKYSGCKIALNVATLAAKFYHVDKIDALFGLECPHSLETVGLMAHAWNIPLFSAAQETHSHNYHHDFETAIKFGGGETDVILRQVLDFYDWYDLAIVIDMDDFVYKLQQGHFEDVGRKRFNIVKFWSSRASEKQYLNALIECSHWARVVLLMMQIKFVEQLLSVAEKHAYTTGDYAFLILIPHYLRNFGWSDRLKSCISCGGYRALVPISVSLNISEGYLDLNRRLKIYVKRKYGQAKSELFNAYDISFFDVTLYEMVQVYAAVLAEIKTAKNLSRFTAETFTNLLLDNTFTGISGEMHIDHHGMRELHYDLNDFDVKEKRFIPILRVSPDGMHKISQRDFDWIKETVPKNEPECGFSNMHCQNSSRDDSVDAKKIAVIAMVVFAVPTLIGYMYIYRRVKRENSVMTMPWRIHFEELLDAKPSRRSFIKSNVTLISSSTSDMCRQYNNAFTNTLKWRGTVVSVKLCNVDKIELTRPLLNELSTMHSFQHDNINKFVGACVDPQHICVLFQYEAKGSLLDLLCRENIKMDWSFKLSLLQDLAQGVRFLHNSSLHSHGYLKSSKCLVDSRFVLKITHYGCGDFQIHQRRLAPNEEQTENEIYTRLLWRAPELLRKFVQPYGTQAGDIYSIGMIIDEVLTDGHGPFADASLEYSVKELVEMVKNTQTVPLRPILAAVDYPPDIKTLAESCWAESIADRPDIEEVVRSLRKMNRKSHGKNLMEIMLERVERYASDLESLVEEKTGKFLEEKKKAEGLLEQMLPKAIADQLKLGLPVVPESYKCVTIYFSDIVGFTNLCSTSQPLEVVDMLNDMYTSFDSVISRFNVYKVETIGDAYMVASGLPERNANEHAREISNMALVLLARIKMLKIRHRPDTTLQLRIGIHSGSVVTGVVGIKMPRYCLFGDTVNTASRMESHGESMRIHISEDTKTILDMFGLFAVEPRSEISVKGKGMMQTYWLIGSDVSYMTIQDRIVLGIQGTKITENSILMDSIATASVSNVGHSSTYPQKDDSLVSTGESKRLLLVNNLGF